MMRRLRNDIRCGASIKRLAAGDLDGIRELASGTVYPTWCDGKRYWQNWYCHVGTLATLPAVGQVPEFSKALIVEDAVGGIKMRPLELIATRNRSNALAWLPSSRQVLFSEGGVDATPVRTVTAAGATGTIGTLGTIPANLFSTDGMCIEASMLFSRGATAAGTVTVVIGMGGLVVSALAAITANADRIALFECKVWSRTATSQSCTYNCAGMSQVTSGTLSTVAITTTSAFAVTADFSSATTNDVLQVSAFTVWVS